MERIHFSTRMRRSPTYADVALSDTYVPVDGAPSTRHPNDEVSLSSELDNQAADCYG